MTCVEKTDRSLSTLGFSTWSTYSAREKKSRKLQQMKKQGNSEKGFHEVVCIL